MKDLPHHIKKLNRRVIRSMHREEEAEEAYDLSLPSPPPRKKSERAKKKQAKLQRKQEKQTHIPTPPTPQEKNKKMRERVPVFERLSHAKGPQTKPSRKKTPPL